MIGSTKQSIFEANRRIYNDAFRIFLYPTFLYEITKSRLKVDRVDSVMDKLESVKLFLNDSIIEMSYKYSFEGKVKDGLFIVIRFLHGSGVEKSHKHRTIEMIARRKALRSEINYNFLKK